jgi:uncharacterized protein (UPF0276 family)
VFVDIKTGIGFRAPHHHALFDLMPDVGFLEIHAENHMAGVARAALLERARQLYPISVHGVGLSLGSTTAVDAAHLERFAELATRVEPLLISEHVAWCRQDGVYLNDLLPLPYTEEALNVLTGNVALVQDRLKRQILMENPSSYVEFAHSCIPEGEFLSELARRSGCGILLDVNNLYVNAWNHRLDPMAVIEALSPDFVGEIHVAGHRAADLGDGVILIDNHGSDVAKAVWDIYAFAAKRFPRAPTLVERDSDIPPLVKLVAEAALADRYHAAALRPAA